MATVPDGTLMQRAAAGLAAACVSLLQTQPGFVYGANVAVLAGSGDNGGDALYAAARLAERGASVTAVKAAEKIHEQALSALMGAGGTVVANIPPDTDLVIDGLLGIGGRGGLREPFATLARQARQSDAVIVAVDLPSGIDADTGEVDGDAIRADVTMTFGTLKPGLLIDPGASHAGAVHLVDIGLDLTRHQAVADVLQNEDVANLLPRPTTESDKYRRGVLGLLAGSDRFGGAPVLATGGAIRGGAGMVRVVTTTEAAHAVRQHWPEAVITEGDPARAGRVQAWVAGPGMGTDDAARSRLASILGADVPILVDADGITLLTQLRDELSRRDKPTLITPHAGELARLLDADVTDIERRRLEHARRAASELNVTVLLKGSTTVVAAPGAQTVMVNPTGTPWLATAGSGDVLSGVIGAFLA
ncbi:MAG TPA: NAD(P)H-hydrate dehydratase, partial [Streptosporangiaceae bacterium]|nr:NAD(P)H-hydrate dehydratase [Streptosporangiaceae bacterium]